jgi:hypothetical protein
MTEQELYKLSEDVSKSILSVKCLPWTNYRDIGNSIGYSIGSIDRWNCGKLISGIEEGIDAAVNENENEE